MIHPHTELKFIREEIGYGVVATRFISKGTITWVLDALDRKFNRKQVLEFAPEYWEFIDKYTYRDNRGDFILCWDHARFVNHSFQPSCITTAYDFELAVRDIHPGQELTNDYGTLNVWEPFYCLPEKGSGRKVVLPEDLLKYHRRWDRQLAKAFKVLHKVDQPLTRFISPQIYEKALAIANGEHEMDSIVSCYCGEVSSINRMNSIHT